LHNKECCKLRTINKLKPGESGTVLEIGSSGALRRRIIDMGITPGATVTMKKMAPLGDPIEICVRGYNLSIRKTEAKEIAVEKIANFCGEKAI
jgi:ferrous iron transport protein A